jgi:aspartyl-tRNA(Asn)/glutamyl-tRNA(Gln) amidotransferase subunit B
MTWEIVIGIETHVQLQTASKIFSNASTTFGAAPNSQASVVDLALPGTLPVMNKKAVECAIKFGLAVNDGNANNIAPRSVFARKNYFYPDLPKGYQISQMDLPVVTGGNVPIQVDGVDKVITLTRAHLEEDAGKSFHEGLDTPGVSGIDLNRAGTPLLEVVTEPDMRSAAEAVAYAKALHGIVTWIGICDGNMQEGSFRCDANVSVRRLGEPLGTRCEIKNLNSFMFMEQAINYEVRRQIELIEDGGKVIQQTRLYDADRDETRAMRSKEDAMDYRYFPCPDLLPLAISANQIDLIKLQMGESANDMHTRFVESYKVPREFAVAVTASRLNADYFDAYYGHLLSLIESVKSGFAKDVATWQTANWFLQQAGAELNRSGYTSISQTKIKPEHAALLTFRVIDQTLNHTIGKNVFSHMLDNEEDGDPDAIIAARGLTQMSDVSAIEKIVDAVLASNEKSVAEFKSGKEKALQALIGQVMKASQGKANPAQVNEILRQKLNVH